MKAFCADAVVSLKDRVCGLPATQGSVLGGRGCDARSGLEVEGWPRCGGGAACDHLRVPCTVLIVDDHDGFRSLAKALLESEGFEVVGEAGDALALSACQGTATAASHHHHRAQATVQPTQNGLTVTDLKDLANMKRDLFQRLAQQTQDGLTVTDLKDLAEVKRGLFRR
jgi:CheY-like chemotaxis protein